VIGIEIELLTIGTQPANGRLAVLDLGWKDGLLTEPVFHAGHCISSGRHPRKRAWELAATHPAAAMNVNDDGQRKSFRRDKAEERDSIFV
jgi:hypothetical protein